MQAQGLTSHFRWHDRSLGSVRTRRSGRRRSADHDRGSCVSLAKPSRITEHPAQPPTSAVRGGASLAPTRRKVAGRPRGVADLAVVSLIGLSALALPMSTLIEPEYTGS